MSSVHPVIKQEAVTSPHNEPTRCDTTDTSDITTTTSTTLQTFICSNPTTQKTDSNSQNMYVFI